MNQSSCSYELTTRISLVADCREIERVPCRSMSSDLVAIAAVVVVVMLIERRSMSHIERQHELAESCYSVDEVRARDDRVLENTESYLFTDKQLVLPRILAEICWSALIRRDLITHCHSLASRLTSRCQTYR
jgi:hypothetical protein